MSLRKILALLALLLLFTSCQESTKETELYEGSTSEGYEYDEPILPNETGTTTIEYEREKETKKECELPDIKIKIASKHAEEEKFKELLCGIPHEYYEGIKLFRLHKEGDYENCQGGAGWYWWYGEDAQEIEICRYSKTILIHELAHHKTWKEGATFEESCIKHYYDIFGAAEDEIWGRLE